MAMARHARPDEAEALYRRASDLFEDPAECIEALLRLAQLRALDEEIARRAVEGLRSLGRYGEVIDVCQRLADSVGGAVGAAMLLDAAQVAGGELGDESRASELRDRAYLLDPLIAVEEQFEPLMAAGQFETALAFADRAEDADRARRALWSLAQAEGASARTQRLATELRQLAAFDRILELAKLLEQGGSTGEAAALFEEVALGAGGAEQRIEALERLDQLGQGPRMLALAAQAIDQRSPAAWVDAILGRARDLGGSTLFDVLNKIAAALPWRSSLLRVELGELYLDALGQPEKARDAFELALTEEVGCIPAVQRLVELYAGGDRPDRFVALVERLASLLGAPAVEQYREPLVRAHLALGRKLDALQILSLLEETPERLRQRADIALELGLKPESLRIRERLCQTDEEREEVLSGYLEAGLIAEAVVLAHGMLERGEVSAAMKKTLALRLSASTEGAALAVSLWPGLLTEEVANAEGWKAFAEALRRVDRDEAASVAYGFFIGLSGAPAPCPVPRILPVEKTAMRSEVRRPGQLVLVAGESMPKLHQALSSTLSALGSEVERVYLDPAGGAEAYLLRDDELVLGAGALSCFGPAELAYLCALALALGARAPQLAHSGPIEGLEQAATVSFAAVPSSLAATRVLTILDEQVRGGDPSRMNALEVLSGSSAFRAIARRALSLM
jgi:tetratricopeptide (TPR) repeat protein